MLNRTPMIGLPNNPYLGEWRGYNRGFNRYGEPTTPFKRAVNRIKDIPRSFEFVRHLYNRFSSSFDETDLGYTTADQIVETTINDIDESLAFYWAHFMDPHYPFAPAGAPDRDSNVGYTEEEITKLNSRYSGQQGEPETLSADELDALRTLYGENIKFLDRQLDRFFEALETRGLYEESLIVVTADHGEAFGEHGVYNHQWGAVPIDELTHVPLLMKLPGDRPSQTINHLVGHSDVYGMLRSYFTEGVSPVNTPIFNKENRIVLSKSNYSIRGVSASGEVIRKKNGSLIERGTVDSSLKNKVQTAAFPEVKDLKTGKVPGGEANRNVKEQLEQLGYIDN